MAGFRNPVTVWTNHRDLGSSTDVSFNTNKKSTVGLSQILGQSFEVRFSPSDVCTKGKEQEAVSKSYIREAQGIIGALICKDAGTGVRVGLYISRTQSGPISPAAGNYAYHRTFGD